MNFVTFETMYQYLWELIYNILAIFEIDVIKPVA